MQTRKNLKIISILFALIVPILTIAAMVYFSVFYDKTSAQLVLAKSAIENGDKEKAFNIYYDISTTDKSCEEAYRALAELSEEKSNYKDAGYFWSQAARLNPLDKALLLKSLECSVISREDNLLSARYIGVQDKQSLPEELRFNIALAFLRMKLLPEFEEISKNMQSADFKLLLEAYKFISEKNFLLAEKRFEDLSSSKNLFVKNQSLFGLSMCKSMTGNIDAAQAELEKIKDASLFLEGDKLILEGKILKLKGENKKALEKFLEAGRFQRSNVILSVESAELAYSLEDSARISELITRISQANRDMLVLKYYFEALNAGAKRNWSEAQKNLELSENFKDRFAARLLAIKCAIESNNPNLAAINLDALPIADLSTTMKDNIVNALVPLLKNNQKSVALYTAMNRLAPDNIFTNILLMKDSLRLKDFKKAVEESEKVLAVNPYDKSAITVLGISALNLNKPDLLIKNVLKYLEKNVDDIDARLLLARGYVQKSDIENAKINYLKALKSSDYITYVAEEAGFFFINNKLDADFNALIASLAAKENAIQKSLGLALEAEFLMRADKKAQAAEKLEEAIKITPEVESLYTVLAYCLFSLDKKAQARKVFEEGIAKLNAENLKFQFALLLSEGTKEECKEALELLKSIYAKHQDSKNILTMMAVVQLKLGLQQEALNSAKKANELALNSSDTLYLIGKIMYERKHYEEAIHSLERALFNDEKNQEIKKTLSEVLNAAIASNPPVLQKRLYLERLVKLDASDKKSQEELKKVNELISESRNAK